MTDNIIAEKMENSNNCKTITIEDELEHAEKSWYNALLMTEELVTLIKEIANDGVWPTKEERNKTTQFSELKTMLNYWMDTLVKRSKEYKRLLLQHNLTPWVTYINNIEKKVLKRFPCICCCINSIQECMQGYL